MAGYRAVVSPVGRHELRRIIREELERHETQKAKEQVAVERERCAAVAFRIAGTVEDPAWKQAAEAIEDEIRSGV